jgi:hypothetical protein
MVFFWCSVHTVFYATEFSQFLMIAFCIRMALLIIVSLQLVE